MTATSQNGFVALSSDSHLLYAWVIPAKNGSFKIRLRTGSAGFLLAYFLLWLSESVEDLTGGITDDWGYASRNIRGSSTTLSNHASGTAVDANATHHPLGKHGTWSPNQIRAINNRLHWKRLMNAIRWGENYEGRIDPMHFEINTKLSICEKAARWIMKWTPRGRRIIKANPTQKRVINS